MSITSRVDSCWKARKIRDIISKFVFLSHGHGSLQGVHFRRLAGLPTSLLWVSGFRAARRQRIAYESGDTPGSGHPVTHPYLWCLGNEAHFLLPGSHFVFIPAFCFSTVLPTHTPAFHSRCWNCSIPHLSVSVSHCLSLSVFFFAFSRVLPLPRSLSQFVLTKGQVSLS